LLKDVSQVSLLGNVQVTAQALREIAAAGIPLCHFSYGGWFHAMTTGLVHKNIELRIAQFRTAADPAESLRLARQIVLGKIRNGRTLLRRHLADDSRDALKRLDVLAGKAEAAADMATLLGVEGMAGKVYFEGFATLLHGDPVFDFESRNRRPPKDSVNALLSFVYAMLTKDLTLTLQAVGFDPMLGVYHQPRYGRPSLALDLVEEFRPIVADSVVLTLVNNGEVSAGSFLRRGGGVVLTDAGRRAVIAAYERRMDSLVTHPVFGYRISYRRVLEVQSRLLARAVLGELSDYPCFYTR
jgi:CRISP-associated protein Cas1